MLNSHSRKFLDGVQLCGEGGHILLDFLFRDFGVNLRRADVLMSQNRTDRFDRHTVRQADRRGHRVTAGVPRDFFLDAADSHYFLDVVADGAVLRDGEYLAVLADTFVFLVDHLGNVEQLHLRQDRRFLAGDMNPLVIVEIRADVVLRQVVQFAVGQAREAAEHEQVAHEFELGFRKAHIHQHFQLLVRQKRPLRFLHADLVLDERVAHEPSVLDGDGYHLAQRHKIHPYRIVGAMVFRAEVQLEIVDERGGDLFQCDVVHMVSRFEKTFQVAVHRQVFLLRGLGSHPSPDHLVEIAVELVVNFHQRFMAVFQT